MPRILSRIEDAGRAALLLGIRALVGTPRQPAWNVLRGQPHRVLFIREDALGDVTLSLSAIRAIAESHPGTTVDVLTSTYAADVVRGLPYVHDVLAFPRDDRRRLHAAHIVRQHAPYDVVVDGMVLRAHARTRSIAIMAASSARYWVGEVPRRNDLVYNIRVPAPASRLPHIERMMRLAAPFLPAGARPELRPLLTVTEDDRAAAEAAWRGTSGRGMRVLINVSASGVERHWPAERYRRVARHLRERVPDARLLVVGLARDAADTRAVASGGGGSALVPSSVRALIAVVAAADLVITPDTSVMHFASAFRRTTLSLHNPHKEEWMPYDTPGVRVVGSVPQCLRAIEAGDVMRALDAVLAATAEPHVPASAATRVMSQHPETWALPHDAGGPV